MKGQSKKVAPYERWCEVAGAERAVPTAPWCRVVELVPFIPFGYHLQTAL